MNASSPSKENLGWETMWSCWDGSLVCVILKNLPCWSSLMSPVRGQWLGGRGGVTSQVTICLPAWHSGLKPKLLLAADQREDGCSSPHSSCVVLCTPGGCYREDKLIPYPSTPPSNMATNIPNSSLSSQISSSSLTCPGVHACYIFYQFNIYIYICIYEEKWYNLTWHEWFRICTHRLGPHTLSAKCHHFLQNEW